MPFFFETTGTNNKIVLDRVGSAMGRFIDKSPLLFVTHTVLD